MHNFCQFWHEHCIEKFYSWEFMETMLLKYIWHKYELDFSNRELRNIKNWTVLELQGTECTEDFYKNDLVLA